MELCDYLTQLRHDWRVFWLPCLGHTPFCFSSIQWPVSLSFTPSDSNCPSSPVTTHFFTLVREHFQVEAKLAYTHLSRFWSWTHLASPTESQQMVHWAHVLGRIWGCLIGVDKKGVKLYHSTHFTHSDIPIQITAICATIDDNVTLSGVLGLTSCLTLSSHG